MPQQTLESGDLFEKTHAAWLREHLPGYEQVWARFIGKDSPCQALPMDGLDEEAAKARKMFCQSHYSLALYCRLLFDVTDETLERIRIPRPHGSQISCEDYLNDSRAITLFLALLGQICDMVEAIAVSLKQKEIAGKITEFSKERNNAIHAARVPMAEDYAGPKIAIIAHDQDSPGFENRRPWDSLSPHDFQYFEDWLSLTRNKLFSTLRSPIYPMIEKGAIARFGGREVTISAQITPASPGAFQVSNGSSNATVCFSVSYPGISGKR